MIKFLRDFRKYNEILGMNRRNQEYFRGHNTHTGKKIADNKIKTKKVLSEIGIQTPELFKVIRSVEQLNHIDWSRLPRSFVIKPNRGSTGRGILILYGKRKNEFAWVKSSGQIMRIPDLELHIEKILQGRFSMGSSSDIAIIEERVINDNRFKEYSYKGVPDIRVIVYNQIPVMAMMRIPTINSGGTANLHTGAIGAGIDIESGVTTTGIRLKGYSIVSSYDYDIVEHTDTGLPIAGIKIPYWDKILQTSIKCAQASGLGFLGVDLAIDRNNGPVVFEVNARPGVSIQLANLSGLRSRLERVEGLKIKNVNHGVRISKSLFGGEIVEEIESITGKELVKVIEPITVRKPGTTKKKNKESVKAMMDTGVKTSRIDKGLASRLGFTKSLKYFYNLLSEVNPSTSKEVSEFIKSYEEIIQHETGIKRLARVTEDGELTVRPVVEMEVKISGQTKLIEMVVSSTSVMNHPIRIGQKELKDYLIDGSRTF